MTSYDLRSSSQYEYLAALSIVEKARYYAEAAQQLSYEVLAPLLPTLSNNLEILKSINLREGRIDRFVMDFQFCVEASIVSYERLIRVIRNSKDDESLYHGFCSQNSKDTLPELCSIFDSIWEKYWKQFHLSGDKMSFLNKTRNKLVNIYSHISIRGNEKLPDGYRCLGCVRDTGYLKIGRTDVCNIESEDNKGTSSMNYCYHLIDVKENSKFVNIERVIFERRQNEDGISQQ